MKTRNLLKKTLFTAVFALLLYPATTEAQEKPAPIRAGVELDFLPYALKGYFGAIWAGKDHWRVRGLHTRVKMPEFLDPDDFENHWISSSALLVDYFPGGALSGWWLGAGPVLYNGRIEPEDLPGQVHYTSYLLNGSAGYVFTLSDHLYCSPWAGMSLRIAGDNEVTAGDLTTRLRGLNPELSFKVGYIF